MTIKEYFEDHEFACKCGCGLNVFDPKLRMDLNVLRYFCGFAFIINSGCRCEKHNKAVDAKANSEHLVGLDGLCHGADIKVTNSSLRDLFLEKYYTLRHDGKIAIWRVGLHEKFIHVGNDLTKPQGVAFLY
jgi:hypothetical protein